MGLNLHGPIEQELERIQNEKKNVSQGVWKPGDRVVFGDMPGTLVRIIPGSDETWEMRPDDGTTKLFVGYDDIEKYTKKNDPKNSDSTTVPIETKKENAGFKKGDQVKLPEFDGESGDPTYKVIAIGSDGKYVV